MAETESQTSIAALQAQCDQLVYSNRSLREALIRISDQRDTAIVRERDAVKVARAISDECDAAEKMEANDTAENRALYEQCVRDRRRIVHEWTAAQ